MDDQNFSDGYEDYEEDDCDHENFDGDILTGRAMCYRCGHAWWMSSDEMKAEMRFQCEYQNQGEE